MTENNIKTSLVGGNHAASIRKSTIIDTSHQIEDRIKECIEKLNNQGRYQKVLFSVLVLSFALACLFLVGNGFLFMNPTFVCDGKDTI